MSKGPGGPNPIRELAWAAGFFDGEGSAWSPPYRIGNKLIFRVSITQVHREPLDRFAEAVSGGKVYGPYERKIRHHCGNEQPFHQYIAQGRVAIKVFRLLSPFLSSIKQKQGDAALARAVQ